MRGEQNTELTLSYPPAPPRIMSVRRLAGSNRFLASTLLLMVGVANGQNTLGPLSIGQPVVANSSGSSGAMASSSPLYVDATQFNGAPDVCAQIKNAINLGGNGAVVDARGFIGDQQCNSNMFGTSNPTGKLLLGNIALHISKTQVQPSKFQVEGIGWSIGSSNTNSVIRACTASDSTGLCPTGAFAANPLVMWCWGPSGGCSTSATPGNALFFGSLTQYVSLDCAGLNGCTEMQAYYLQEGSGCWHCQFRGWYNNGIGLDICDPNHANGSCQNSSYFDIYATVPTGATCGTGVTPNTAIPIRVDTGGADPGPKFIKQVTVDASKCTNGTGPYDSIRFSAKDTTLENVLVGQGTIVGVHVGGDGDVNNVTLNNIQAANVANGYSGNQCGSSSSSTSATIVLDNAHLITNATLTSIGVDAATPPTNLIVDCANGNTIVRAGAEQAVAQYSIGPKGPSGVSGLVAFTTSSSVPTFPNTFRLGVNTITASGSATLDMSKGSIQQVTCTGSGTQTLSTANLQSGMIMTFIFVQNASGTACTLTYPSNMHGWTNPSSSHNSVSTQQFVVSNHGSDLYATAAGTQCISACGAP